VYSLLGPERVCLVDFQDGVDGFLWYRRPTWGNINVGHKRLTAGILEGFMFRCLIRNTSAQDHGLMIHSDQGFHYQHYQWVNRLEKRNIKQSMSRRGNCLDNAPMENLFGLLKQEMYHGEEFRSIHELKRRIVKYIHWYNHKRIKEKLNGLSPVEYRRQTA